MTRRSNAFNILYMGLLPRLLVKTVYGQLYHLYPAVMFVFEGESHPWVKGVWSTATTNASPKMAEKLMWFFKCLESPSRGHFHHQTLLIFQVMVKVHWFSSIKRTKRDSTVGELWIRPESQWHGGSKLCVMSEDFEGTYGVLLVSAIQQGLMSCNVLYSFNHFALSVARNWQFRCWICFFLLVRMNRSSWKYGVRLKLTYCDVVVYLRSYNKVPLVVTWISKPLLLCCSTWYTKSAGETHLWWNHRPWRHF